MQIDRAQEYEKYKEIHTKIVLRSVYLREIIKKI